MGRRPRVNVRRADVSSPLASPAVAKIVADDGTTRLARAFEEGRLPHDRRPPAATITTMPMPQLKTRCISASATRPCCCSQCEDRRARPARCVEARLDAPGRMRGMFSTRPPPVMWAMPLTCTRASEREQRLHVDAGRRHAAHRRASSCLRCSGARRSARALRRRSGGSARSRCCAARSTRGRARRRPAAIARPSMIVALLDGADGEAGQVVFAVRVHAGHFGGLAADQRAAGLLAAGGDAARRRAPRRRRRAGRRRSSRGRTAARRPARARR